MNKLVKYLESFFDAGVEKFVKNQFYPHTPETQTHVDQGIATIVEVDLDADRAEKAAARAQAAADKAIAAAAIAREAAEAAAEAQRLADEAAAIVKAKEEPVAAKAEPAAPVANSVL